MTGIGAAGYMAADGAKRWGQKIGNGVDAKANLLLRFRLPHNFGNMFDLKHRHLTRFLNVGVTGLGEEAGRQGKKRIQPTLRKLLCALCKEEAMQFGQRCFQVYLKQWGRAKYYGD
jgi:hypothetical protein